MHRRHGISWERHPTEMEARKAAIELDTERCPCICTEGWGIAGTACVVPVYAMGVGHRKRTWRAKARIKHDKGHMDDSGLAIRSGSGP